MRRAFGAIDSFRLIETAVYRFFLSSSNYALDSYAHTANFTLIIGNVLLKWALATFTASTLICSLVVGPDAVFEPSARKSGQPISGILTELSHNWRRMYVDQP
jgi:hypothetical protein